jgi:putative ABC transport system permease protein
MLRFSNLFHLYRVRVRQRLVQEALACFGIAIGVALVFAALVANNSLVGSIEELTSSIVGQAKLEMAARGGSTFDIRTLDRVDALPGVRDAAPGIDVRANLVGPRGRVTTMLVGGDARLARLGGATLRSLVVPQFAHQKVIAVPGGTADTLGVRLGSRVQVETGAGTTTATVGAVLRSADVGPIADSPVALGPLTYVQELAGIPGRVTRILVRPEPGREELVRDGLRRVAGGRVNVLPASDEVVTFRGAATATNQSTALFSVFAALVGFLFALCAVLLTVPQRRRFVDDLRLAGHPPRAIAQVMLFDALVVGAVGSALGLILGDQVSRHLFGAKPGFLAFAFPVGEQRVVSGASVAISVAVGLVAAVLAVMVPIWGALRGRRETTDDQPRRRTRVSVAGTGVVFGAAAGVIAWLTPSSAALAMALLTLSLVCVLPTLLRLGVSLTNVLGHRITSAIPALAVMELRSRRAAARTLAFASTAAVAVFASVAIGGAHLDLQRGLDASTRQIDGNADIWVTFRGAIGFATVPLALDQAQLQRVRSVAGVRSVGLSRGSFLDIDDRRTWVIAPPSDAALPVPTRQLLQGDPGRVTRELRQGGAVVLSESVADVLHVGVGDLVTLPTPVPHRLRVAGLSTNLGWPPGAVQMTATDYAASWGSSAPSALLVRLSRGASPSLVAARLRGALGDAVPLAVETRADREQRHFQDARDGLSRLTPISLLVLGGAILAVATAMAGVLWQRRPVIAGLKIDGFTELQLWKAVLLETSVLVGTSCLVGAVFGFGGQLVLDQGLASITGFPVFYEAALRTAVTNALVIVGAVLVVLSVPGYLAVRVPPASALSGSSV